MTEPLIDSLDVTLNVGGKDVVLACTLEAARKLSRGGLINRMHAISQHDLEVYIDTIAIGAGMEDNELLPQAVFETGMRALEVKVSEFLYNINNPNRHKEEAAAKAAAEAAKGKKAKTDPQPTA